MNLSDRDLLIALHHLPGIGPRKWAQLEQTGEPLLSILHWPDSLLRTWLGDNAFDLWRGWRAGRPGNWLQQRLDKLTAWLEQAPENGLLTRLDTHYPALLRAANGPLLLHYRGDPVCLQAPQLAVVGSRKPTAVGLKLARWFSDELSRSGWVITSGLALGIDAQAHQASMAAGGKTVAVLACGLDGVYPARHAGLCDQIVQQGVVVSEFCLGVKAQTGFFPRRNRIIAGLAEATLVVEAACKSGSLITARLAAEQGRDVFAIPGTPLNPLAAGCNSLLQDGAFMVCEPSQLLEQLGSDLHQQSVPPGAPTPNSVCPEGQLVLQALGLERLNLEQLLAASSLSLGALQQQLLALELAGLIRTTDAGYERLL